MKYLISTTETYRVDTEAEAEALIESAKNESSSILKKYGAVQKERKMKGEVIDSWINVTLVRSFTDEKEPDTVVNVSYEVD